MAWTGRATACAFALAGCLAPAAWAQHPAGHWEFAIESGWLTKVRDNSPLDYRVVPLQAVWRSPATHDLWRAPSGARLVLRHRLALLSEVFVKGAEDYYIGIAGAPSLQLWAPDGRSAGFFEIGGGAGFVNSKGVEGGQGQDLSFNWFAQLGYRRQLDARLGFTAGVYFTHHSNLGMTDPNPGIDVLGVNVGVTWRLD